MTPGPLRDPRANAGFHYLDRHLEEGRGERTCLCLPDRRVTYAELAALAREAARRLAADGVEPENRVVLLLPDGLEFVACFFALLRIGAVPVPLSLRLAPDEYAFVLADCRPKGVVAGAEQLALLERAAAALPPRARVWRAEGGGIGAAAGPEPEVFPASPDDVALVQYTSGSTGRPKGVVHLHRGLVAASRGFGRRLGLAPGDLCFSAAKLSFGYGLGNSIFFPFAAGASSLLHPGLADALTVLDLIARERPTVFFGVPSLYAAILEAPRRPEHDLSGLRLCVSAGEHLSAALFSRFRETFGHEIVDGLGATECLHVFLSGEPGRIKPGSTGTPLPGYEVALLDEEGRPVGPGEVGRLEVKADINAARYWNRHDETLARMRGGWTRTGDQLYRDEEGYFHFVGREDDMIKVGGIKVSPIEVEGCLQRHEAVKECAVVGALSADGIASVHAYVCLAAGWEADRRTSRLLKGHLRAALAAHKVPRRIEFVAELPKTSTGKTARYKLRAAAAAAEAPAEAPGEAAGDSA